MLICGGLLGVVGILAVRVLRVVRLGGAPQVCRSFDIVSHAWLTSRLYYDGIIVQP